MPKLILIAFGVLLLSTQSAWACMCGDKPSVAEARRNASAVFSGKAISSEYQKGAKYPNGKDAGEELAMRFKAERWWKGDLRPEVVLFTEQYQAPDFSISVSSCAHQFEVGKHYIVYAGIRDGKLRANYCSRTSEIKKAGQDLRLLGRGRKPRSTAGRVRWGRGLTTHSTGARDSSSFMRFFRGGGLCASRPRRLIRALGG